jgi:hypothetical protein
MVTGCRLGQRALLRRLSSVLHNVRRGLGYDSQPVAVHSAPVTAGDPYAVPIAAVTSSAGMSDSTGCSTMRVMNVTIAGGMNVTIAMLSRRLPGW